MPKTDHRKNLTPTLITGLKKARKGERYQVMDAQVPGFGVRVTDNLLALGIVPIGKWSQLISLTAWCADARGVRASMS